MDDMNLTLDDNEYIQIGAYLGKVPSNFVAIFVSKESPDELSISLEVDGVESFCCIISDRGKLLKIKKDKYVDSA